MSWSGAAMAGLAMGSLVVALGYLAGGQVELLVGLPVADRPTGAAGRRRVVDRVGRSRIGFRRMSTRAAVALESSGWNLSPDGFAGTRTLAAASTGLLGLVFPLPVRLLAPLLAAAGLRVPVILAERAGRRRRTAIDREIPQLLDLLAAASSAGISAQLALRRAAAAVRGPLAEELDRVLRAIDLGARWRDELGAFADRLRLPDLRRTVIALSRTDTLGASLETSTAELAAGVRAARRAAVTERARTAPVKMLFPLVFLVLPAFLLLTVVPVLLTTLQSIR
jgi:tight adherence protein C